MWLIKPKEVLGFSHKGMMKFKYEGHSLTVEKACVKWLDWKSKHCDHSLTPYLHVQWTKLEEK